MFQKKAKPDFILDIAYRPTLSRLFIFRILWTVLVVWPMTIIGFWFSILSLGQFLHMLLLGERSEPMWRRQMSCIRYLTAWQLYLHFFTDTRPGFWM